MTLQRGSRYCGALQFFGPRRCDGGGRRRGDLRRAGSLLWWILVTNVVRAVLVLQRVWYSSAAFRFPTQPPGLHVGRIAALVIGLLFPQRVGQSRHGKLLLAIDVGFGLTRGGLVTVPRVQSENRHDLSRSLRFLVSFSQARGVLALAARRRDPHLLGARSKSGSGRGQRRRCRFRQGSRIQDQSRARHPGYLFVIMTGRYVGSGCVRTAFRRGHNRRRTLLRVRFHRRYRSTTSERQRRTHRAIVLALLRVPGGILFDSTRQRRVDFRRKVHGRHGPRDWSRKGSIRSSSRRQFR